MDDDTGSANYTAGYPGNYTAWQQLHPLALTGQQQLAAELAISGFGCLIMIFNLIWASVALRNRPNRYNASLLFSATTFFLSQALLIAQSLASGDRSRWYLARLGEQPSNDHSNRMLWDFDLKSRILNLQRAYSACFALATVSYLLLVGFRFRVLKSIMPYRNAWDYGFAAFTVALWTITMLGFNVVFYSGSTSATGLLATLWNLYLLVMDQTLAGVFLWKLSDFQKSLATASAKDADSKAKGKRNVVLSLVGLGVISWGCLGLFVWSHYGFQNDEGMKTLLFRVAAAFSSFTVSSALAFVYGVKQMMTRTMSTGPLSRSSRNAVSAPTTGRKRGGGHDPTSSTSGFLADIKDDGDNTNMLIKTNSSINNSPTSAHTTANATSKHHNTNTSKDRTTFARDAERNYSERRPRSMSAAMNPYGVPLQVLGGEGEWDKREPADEWYTGLEEVRTYAQPVPPPPPPHSQQQRYAAVDGGQGPPPRVDFAPRYSHPRME
ncbi:hypothetical protein HDU87_001417 [Geranomyces variabilis]|uniref:Uncharacterized protein n=1 Tax=Geranomyces variabilis TaxID=109894 RepID=A0AAD5TQ14_9FUNG|nr:hypothetical protein HDU87_001417 [Geranomyces variabilis]